MSDGRVGRRRGERSLKVRLDEMLTDPASPDREWSSLRVYLLWIVTAFIGLSILDPDFRDPGAYVTVIILFVSAVVAPKIFEARFALGDVLSSAASTIGRKFTRKEETVHTTTEEATTTDAEPKPDDDEAAELDVVRNDEEQEP